MKIRKLTALTLIMAMLAIPVLSLGEAAPLSALETATNAGRSVTTTVTFVPGDMLTQNAAMAPIADLLKALKLEAVDQKTENGKYGKFEVYLQDKPSIDFSALVDKDTFYCSSNLYGEKAISFTLDDIMKLYSTQLEKAISQMSQSNDATIAMIGKLYASMLKGDMPAMPEFDQESLQADLMTPLTQWFGNVAGAPVTTDGTFESDKHDAATKQIVYSVSGDQITDLLTILTGWAGKDANLDAILKFASSVSPDTGDLTASKDQIKLALTGLPDKVKTALNKALPEPITVTILQDSTGATKAVELKAGVVGEDASNNTVLAGYYVKTEADGVNSQVSLDFANATDSFNFAFSTKDLPAVSGGQWKLTMGAKNDGKEVFAMNLSFDGQKTTSADGDKDTWKLVAEFNAGGMPVGATLDNTTTTVQNGADVKVDGKLDVTLAGATAPAASILYTTVTGDPVEVPAVPTDTVQIGKMTEEELTAWSQEMSMTMMSQMGPIMQNLPPSVLSMLTSTSTN